MKPMLCTSIKLAEQELTADAGEVEHLHEELAHHLEGELNGRYVEDQQRHDQLEREPDAHRPSSPPVCVWR
jgi:hypothetical protein